MKLIKLYILIYHNAWVWNWNQILMVYNLQNQQVSVDHSLNWISVVSNNIMQFKMYPCCPPPPKKPKTPQKSQNLQLTNKYLLLRILLTITSTYALAEKK